MTENKHPGYKSGKLELEPQFKNFAHFIHLEGIDEKIKGRYMSFLIELFKKTSDSWEPGLCKSTRALDVKGHELLQRLHFNDIRIEPRSYNQDHFWLEVEIEDTKLIIDPFGCPEDPHTHMREDILPYFGPLENVSEDSFAQKVYSQGTQLPPYGYKQK